MNSNGLNTQNNYCYECVSRISLHQAHIELSNGIIDVTIPFTNELSDSIILVLKLNTIFCISVVNFVSTSFSNHTIIADQFFKSLLPVTTNR